jgi:hypothetical protein
MIQGQTCKSREERSSSLSRVSLRCYERPYGDKPGHTPSKNAAYIDWPGLSMYFDNANMLCFDLSYRKLASDSHIFNSAGCVVNMLELSISYQIPACSSINIQSSGYEESIDFKY